MDKYFEILEEIATSIAGTMAPTPIDVVGRENKHKQKNAMKYNYKFKKSGELHRRSNNSEIFEDEEARKQVLDRIVQQLNKNSNDFILNKKPDMEDRIPMSTVPKNNSIIQQKIDAQNKSESNKLGRRAVKLYNIAKKKGNIEAASAIGNAILKNREHYNASESDITEACFRDIVNLITEFLIEY